MYPRTVTVDPRTSEQQLNREAFSKGCEAWSALTATQKDAWNRYARDNDRYFDHGGFEPLSGYRVFQSCAKNRQLLGLPIVMEPPRARPPEGVKVIEFLPSPDEKTIRLRLHHLEGGALRVLVSMSPPTLRRSRKPDRRNGRTIKGWSVASTAVLPKSGRMVEFTDVRYALPANKRCGIWVRVIRESDGLARQEVFEDVMRGELVPDPEPTEEPTAEERYSASGGIMSKHVIKSIIKQVRRRKERQSGGWDGGG